ncbi:unnamed protein product [Vitrella brassicaformis CCMP3155]|uniref:Uncharacterized protein n=1 Tax=Vitrella brassicaformis (strain CCMP3155) TaxID=1169540 RepID=A0A0G4G892_VITBC|nr:unnamed protein product [Vitrella brassicaformis CCMP3155]|eukprot:CEM24960.1 unnamed protein product [Vitrella brassicaformis CCMP3155]
MHLRISKLYPASPKVHRRRNRTRPPLPRPRPSRFLPPFILLRTQAVSKALQAEAGLISVLIEAVKYDFFFVVDRITMRHFEPLLYKLTGPVSKVLQDIDEAHGCLSPRKTLLRPVFRKRPPLPESSSKKPGISGMKYDRSMEDGHWALLPPF